MWLAVVVLLGGISVAAAVMRRRAKTDRRRLETGAVSDSWLAEHRGTKDD
jgi:hypothetical protein